MSVEGSGGNWGGGVLNHDEEVWQAMAEQFIKQMKGLGEQNTTADVEVEVGGADTEEPEPEVAVDTEVPSQRDGIAPSERYQEDLEARLVAENQERMTQSEAEMEAFQRKLAMSPERYWQELKDEYAQKGFSLGMMPDVREMRTEVQDYLTEQIGDNQKARVDMAIKTELEKMAQSKADEIEKWRADGRGLPVTFESEWIEAGKRDLKNILGTYYGEEGDFGKQARNNDELSEDEQVAWQMAALPQAPGTLNPVFVVKSYAGRFEGETAPEYYNRLKNYRTQDQMREWQLRQDQGRQVIDRGEEPKTEAELAAEQLERDPEGVREAIEETDAEVEELSRRRAELSRADMVEEVVKEEGFLLVVQKMIKRAIDWMRLDEFAFEEDEDNGGGEEMEEQEAMSAEAAEKEEDAEVETEAEKRMLPEEVGRWLSLAERTKRALAADNLTEAERASAEANLAKIEAMLDEHRERYGLEDFIEYQTNRELEAEEDDEDTETVQESEEVKEEVESIKEREGEYYAEWLKNRGLFSGEIGKSSLVELETLRLKINEDAIQALLNEDGIAMAECREVLMAINRTVEWLELEKEAEKIVPFRKKAEREASSENAALRQ